MKKLPELLCPAGSPEALDAAIEGGADAIYLGGAFFNARMNAKNFGGDALRSAVLRAHSYGVKIYLTLNTLVNDREVVAYVDAAREALQAGVDALIVADLGGAAVLRRVFPDAELHASTQMSAHNTLSGKLLGDLGFSRMVVARETSAEDLRTLVKESPIEIEAFIHGALCVSHSGQCLFSSVVGGRSGNRGECAQPCRLPFSCAGCKGNGNDYPLSLKDLTLAAHVPELIDIGIASLKIEGRMKAPEYVRDTARIWRRLLDECRAATPTEMKALSDAFSRGGFTDGYFTQRITHKMLGIRSDADKSNSRAIQAFEGITRRVPLNVSASIRAGIPASLSLSDGIHTVTATGDVPMEAINAPLSSEAVKKSLSKFGGTSFEVTDFSLDLDDGLMLPVSRLNDLRRRALQALEAKLIPSTVTENELHLLSPSGTRTQRRTARFYSPEQITPRARAFFERIFLPLHRFAKGADGVVIPPVVFDHDREAVEQMLKSAVDEGAKYALVGNLGHLELARRAKLIPVGDYRLNITNAQSVAQLEALGIEECLLSPELTLPQMRDVGGNTEIIVFGRLPLMTLEKCVIREIADCRACDGGRVLLRDRRGVEFPVLREWEHRNVIYNSLPTSMSDREDAMNKAGLNARHFLFSTETAQQVDRVIDAFTSHTPLGGQVRRI